MLAKQQKKKRKDRSNTHATEMGMRSVGNERKENKSYQGKHSEQSRNYHRNSHLNIQQRSTTNSQYNSVANAGGVDLLGIQPFSYGLQTTTMMAPVVHNAVQPFQRPPIPKGPPPVPYGQPPISSYPLVPSTPSVPWQG